MEKKQSELQVKLGKLGKFVIFLVLSAMVIMVFVNAIARYLFATNFPVFEELSRFAFVWTAFLGAILAYKEGKHVGVDVLVSALKGKKKLFVQILGHIIVLGCLLVIGWGAWNYFLITAHTPAPSSNLPFGVVSVAAIVLVVCMLIIAFFNILKDIREFKSGGEETK